MLIGWKAARHDPAIASFRYRVEEPVAALAARGHAVELFRPEQADRYDLLIFSKSYRAADQALARTVKARGGRVVLDLCDNHFYNPYKLPRYVAARADLLAMLALADRVVASTPVLAAAVRAEARLAELPHVVGDVVERIALPSLPPPALPELLWFGSHGSPNAPAGMTDLLRIAPALQAQHRRTPFELVVASNDPAKFGRVAPELGVPARYVDWTRDGFTVLLAAASGVVIPLSDNPFVAAKTHNRLTTALWAGVPVVADTIDSYREFAPFAWLGDWTAGLAAVLEDNAAARARAAEARAYLDAHWSIAQLAPAWERALGLVAPVQASEVEELPPAQASPATLYQGALDPPQPDRITGWARLIPRPDQPVRVALQVDGETVATADAVLPRPDLEAAGFRPSSGGFVLDVPPALADGRARRFAVVADGARVIEEGVAAFRAGAMPVLRDVPAAVDDGLRIKDEIARQSHLTDELEALAEALEEVRRVAARVVLAAGRDGHAP